MARSFSSYSTGSTVTPSPCLANSQTYVQFHKISTLIPKSPEIIMEMGVCKVKFLKDITKILGISGRLGIASGEEGGGFN